MPSTRFNFAALAIVLVAAPFWVLVAVEVSMSHGFGLGYRRHVMGPLILCGLTAAIYRLIRPRRNAWYFSALLAGIGALTVLAWAAG